MIASPSNMLIWPDQNEVALVDISRAGLVNIENLQRNFLRGSRGLDRPGLVILARKIEQREPHSKSVKQ